MSLPRIPLPRETRFRVRSLSLNLLCSCLCACLLTAELRKCVDRDDAERLRSIRLPYLRWRSSAVWPTAARSAARRTSSTPSRIPVTSW